MLTQGLHRIRCCVATVKCSRERATVLRYTYIAYLVVVHKILIRRVQPTRCNVSQFIYICKMLYMFQTGFTVHHQELKTAASPGGLAAGSSNGLTNT